MKVIAILVTLILMTGCLQWVTPTPCPTCVPVTAVVPTATATRVVTPEPDPILWDPKLTEIGVTVQRVAGARYQMIAAWSTRSGNWDDVPSWAKKWQQDTLGGDHNVFGRCEDLNGNPINKTFVLQWSTGSDNRAPEADGWANLPLAGQNWNPAHGQGPYIWYAIKGDYLVGVGMPLNNHWSFFAVYKEVKQSLPMTILSWFVGD